MEKWFKKNQGTVVLIGAIILIAIFTSNSKQMPVIGTDWQLEFRARTEQIPNTYLESTNIYNYDNENIKMISEQLVRESTDAKDYTQKVLDYVYENVKYDFNEDDTTCFNSKASDILERGSGQCDTQSMLVVALLRAGGVPAYPIGGCIYKTESLVCDMQYAISGMRKPVFRPIEEITFSRGGDPIYSDLTPYFGRGELGRAGGLHAWVTAFTGERWQLLESTAGQIVESSCYVYTEELQVKNVRELCVSDSYEFALWCATQ